MSKDTLSIPNISCGHCVMAIKNELQDMEGVKSVEGNPQAKTVDIEWDAPATTPFAIILSPVPPATRIFCSPNTWLDTKALTPPPATRT